MTPTPTSTPGAARTAPTRRSLAPVLGLLLAVTLVAGCSSDPEQDYCAAVVEHQKELSELVGDGGQDALIRALPIFVELRDKSPDDVGDEWQHLVSRIEALEQALRDAGVDPSTYDRDDPPQGLDEEDRAAIDAAARELGSGTTVGALGTLEEEVRDVCHTSLVS